MPLLVRAVALLIRVMALFVRPSKGAPFFSKRMLRVEAVRVDRVGCEPPIIRNNY